MSRSVWNGPFIDKYVRRKENQKDAIKRAIGKPRNPEATRKVAQILKSAQQTHFRLSLILSLFEKLWDSEPRQISLPPGHFARAVLSFVFSKKAFEGVFSQAIIDMREEHSEALVEGHFWKARWIVARDHLGLVLTVASYICASVGKKIVGIWKMIG